ncbi:hypothetical protein [Pedobacter sp.]|uniref:hypothetical protein n=1 Tax=Pedobacter sp. TaxID=1411316 RepID=UPI003BAC6E3D
MDLKMNVNFVLAAGSPAIANSPRSFLTPGYLALSGLETMVCATSKPTALNI